MKKAPRPAKSDPDSNLARDGIGTYELEYSSHRAQLEAAAPAPERAIEIERACRDAFAKVVREETVAVVYFSELNAEELAGAFRRYPLLVKAVCSCVNVAQRAIARDLGVNIDTYGSGITAENAALLAGYLKPILPGSIAVPALVELDRFFWTDKEMRAEKGRWEVAVRLAIMERATVAFAKRMFSVGREEFELDAASPATPGSKIEIAVDVKRIESPRDIHKRADEVINKATKFKSVYPSACFYAVVYYPFPDAHVNVQSRMKSPHIDGIFFAGSTASSIESAAELLTGAAGVHRPESR